VFVFVYFATEAALTILTIADHALTYVVSSTAAPLLFVFVFVQLATEAALTILTIADHALTKCSQLLLHVFVFVAVCHRGCADHPAH
jgi:purine-nucleoside phosphorylase